MAFNTGAFASSDASAIWCPRNVVSGQQCEFACLKVSGYLVLGMQV